jgi:hypothetical protein
VIEGSAGGAVVLVTSVGTAVGAGAATAALACAGSDSDRPGLLIELANGRAPRPSLVASGGARRLEERLAAHLPAVGVASRGRIVQLKLAADPGGLDEVAAVLPAVRESVAAIHLPPSLLQPALDHPGIRASGALLRADLREHRALTALAAQDLIGRGIRVAVLKRPLGWLSARAALLGTLPASSAALSARLVDRLLGVPPTR